MAEDNELLTEIQTLLFGVVGFGVDLVIGVDDITRATLVEHIDGLALAVEQPSSFNQI